MLIIISSTTTVGANTTSTKITMGLFWRRKTGDQFVTLGLNEPERKSTADEAVTSTQVPEAERGSERVERETVPQPATIEPVVTGAGPTPLPAEPARPEISSDSAVSRKIATPVPSEVTRPSTRQAVVPSQSPFATSVLGLNLSIEELQAQEAALEQEFSTRFRRAVSATRESLSEKIDTVFAGRKQIDDELLDQLEEALIAADIGVPTTLEILETVRRGVARKQINDLEALKQAIKNELLKILQASQNKGVAKRPRRAVRKC